LDASVIDPVVAKLEAHGHVNLGEHGDITAADVKAILTLAL
jgi:NADP-dependent alcohol dehydrogenase